MTEYSEAKSAAAREMDLDQFDDEYDLDRSMRLKIAIEKVFEENADLFERLKNE
jgi:hypothetical protein